MKPTEGGGRTALEQAGRRSGLRSGDSPDHSEVDTGARTRWYQPRPVGIKIGIINGTCLVWLDSWSAMLISSLLEAYTWEVHPGREGDRAQGAIGE